MPKQHDERDIEMIAQGLRPLLKVDGGAESRFAVGDYLIENSPLRPSQLQHLAQVAGRETSTLEQYLKVSTVFPESRRRHDLAWGVFKQLTRVEDEGWQDEFLAATPAATTSAAERAVNAKLMADRRRPDGKSRGRYSDRYSDRAWVPGVEVDLAVFGDGLSQGRLTLDGNIEKAELVFSEIFGQWAVSFVLRKDDAGQAAT